MVLPRMSKKLILRSPPFNVAVASAVCEWLEVEWPALNVEPAEGFLRLSCGEKHVFLLLPDLDDEQLFPRLGAALAAIFQFHEADLI